MLLSVRILEFQWHIGAASPMISFPRRGAASAWAFAVLCTVPLVVHSFPLAASRTSFSPLAPFPGRLGTNVRHDRSPSDGSTTSLNSFMGSDGGLLGIGTPELATILLVGYFLLGPSDLYKIVKEVGKFISNVRTLGSEATKNFESSMESQLELQELRKAQRELNDAFSFRRSINVEDDSEAFSVNAQSPRPQDDAVATTTTTVAKADTNEPAVPRKKKRRVKKKEPPSAAAAAPEPIHNTIPDLDMSSSEDWNAVNGDDDKELPFSSASDMAREDLEWLQDSERTLSPTDLREIEPQVAAAQQTRFQQQLSGNWNDQVLANQDKLEPLAILMQKLALLEEEKAAADRRLEEEFQIRSRQEEEFYRKKRALLEETAAQVQKDAYITVNSGSTNK